MQTLDDFLRTGSKSGRPSQIRIEGREVEFWKGSPKCLSLSMSLGSCQDGG